jgi:hypothetical protein
MKVQYDQEVDVLSIVLSENPSRRVISPGSSWITTKTGMLSALRSWTPFAPDFRQPSESERLNSCQLVAEGATTG